MRILSALAGRLARPLMIVSLGLVSTAGAAVGAPLQPNTKIRLTIVQWMPTKGAYEQWGTLGGEFTISDDGALTLPLLGRVPIGKKDEAALASDIARQLKDKIGLVDEPSATIEILGYPPIYVVGDVAKPGEYQFHTGLTVLQAFAMGGGEMRSTSTLQSSLDVTQLVGELKEIDASIVRAGVTIKRLEAETAGEKTLQFQQELTNADPLTASIYKQEEAIFLARANEVARQSKSLSELRDLLSEEIRVQQEKIKSTDANIKSVQQQLDSTIALIEKGAIVPARQAEVERTMRSYQNDKLDLAASIMRARQGISQATRNLEGLYDRRQTEVASELQSERANLTQLRLKRETKQKLLMDSISHDNGSQESEQPLVVFKIVRLDTGKSSEMEASETTAMLPGDVLKVARRSAMPSTTPSSAQTSMGAAAKIIQ
ncbi:MULTISPECIES: exopolysaccharide biosynthesis protein [unclassified Rhizobium]|uniref:exopolysaccharide biosynthesis protein n=1 Tax=Rhizobium sp. TaxID=391 RepID=UPI00055A6ADE